MRKEKTSLDKELDSENEKAIDLKAKISSVNLENATFDSKISSIKSNIEDKNRISGIYTSKIDIEKKNCSNLTKNFESISEDLKNSVNLFGITFYLGSED